MKGSVVVVVDSVAVYNKSGLIGFYSDNGLRPFKVGIL